MKLTLQRMVIVGLLLCSGCLQNTAGVTPEADLLSRGKQALAEGNISAARGVFSDLSEFGDYPCESAWGLLLADILDLVAELNNLVQTAAPFLDGIVRSAPSLRTSQFNVDFGLVAESLLEPFVELAPGLISGSETVIADGCTFLLEQGLTLQIGEETSFFHLRMVLGSEWDPATARLIQAEGHLIGVLESFLLGHSFKVGNSSDFIGYLFDQFELIDGEPDPETFARTTYIDFLRSLGGVVATNPELWAVGSRKQLNQGHQHLGALIRALHDAQTETGLVADLLARNLEDDNLNNNVLAWIDDGNGRAGNGDTLQFGVRAFDLTSALRVDFGPAGTTAIHFSGFNGDIGRVIDAVHTIAEVVEAQLAAVDDPGRQWRRLGVREFNQVIDNIDLLTAAVPTLPEDLELDLQAFFSGGGNGPPPVRDLLPLWYDHDGLPCDDLGEVASDCTPAVFLIEGESAVTTHGAASPFGDVAHFPAQITFHPGEGVAENLDGLRLAADGFDPRQTGQTGPFPYIAFQDPSFGGALWLDPTNFPLRPIPSTELGYEADPEDGYFRPATHATLNYGLNAFLHYLDGTLDLAALVRALPLVE